MNTELPKHIIEKLIELGKSDKIDDPALSADFEQFRPFEYLGRLHWREEAVTETSAVMAKMTAQRAAEMGLLTQKCK